MRLAELRIADLRCIERAALAPQPGINLIVGDNGAGKTSLLESIYLLGRAGSFRRSDTRSLIRDGQAELTVFARTREPESGLGLARNALGSRARINGQECRKLGDLFRQFPVTVLEPGQHRILEDGPQLRRQFIDWVVFHVEPSFLDVWRRYARSLRQRNAALRHKDGDAAARFHGPLAASAQEVHRMRSSTMQTLLGEIQSEFSALLDFEGLDLRYRSGWLAGSDYREQLEKALAADLARGHTQSGPHRAELSVRLGGRPAREHLSRGQQKLLLAAMVFAQVRALVAAGIAPVLLVDDLASELGPGLRQALWASLNRLPVQSFVSVLEAASLPGAQSSAAMFHVEHGRVGPVV